MPAEGEITRMLGELNGGGRDALDGLFPLVYEELHRLAHRQLRTERSDHTLGPTALVHEAYLKLSGLDRIEWQNRAHFMAVAAQAMRRVLINYAEARSTQKRGGTWAKLSLDDVIVIADERVGDLLALDQALTRLAEIDARQARVVECRFFAGMSIDETADALGVAPATVKRDWTCARAWLNRELDASA
ncbi:MAG TPA: sigma-70 family RNA polymerase sigma factor [Longimicrobiales bacterium]